MRLLLFLFCFVFRFFLIHNFFFFFFFQFFTQFVQLKEFGHRLLFWRTAIFFVLFHPENCTCLSLTSLLSSLCEVPLCRLSSSILVVKSSRSAVFVSCSRFTRLISSCEQVMNVKSCRCVSRHDLIKSVQVSTSYSHGNVQQFFHSLQFENQNAHSLAVCSGTSLWAPQQNDKSFGRVSSGEVRHCGKQGDCTLTDCVILPEASCAGDSADAERCFSPPVHWSVPWSAPPAAFSPHSTAPPAFCSGDVPTAELRNPDSRKGAMFSVFSEQNQVPSSNVTTCILNGVFCVNKCLENRFLFWFSLPIRHVTSGRKFSCGLYRADRVHPGPRHQPSLFEEDCWPWPTSLLFGGGQMRPGLKKSAFWGERLRPGTPVFPSEFSSCTTQWRKVNAPGCR